MPGVIERASRAAIDLLFPPRCALCARNGALLCAVCVAALPAAAGARCPICWMPSPGGATCAHCLATPPAFASLRAACVLEGGARRLAHELKYEGMTALAQPMARLMARLAPPDADAIIGVPLHRGRERSRGYNQSADLARWLARETGTALLPRALARIRRTAPLAKTMRREERRAIVAGAFAARPVVAGLRILLVDDVATTGATLDSAAGALHDAGAADVRCLTWARAE